MGLDLSTVVAFFNFAPFLISPNNASLPGGIDGGGPGGKFPKPDGGGEEEVVVVVQPLLYLKFQINEEAKLQSTGKRKCMLNLVSVICS